MQLGAVRTLGASGAYKEDGYRQHQRRHHRIPGNLVWSKKNKYLNAFDQLCGGVNAACAYWVAIAGSAGTITGTSGNFLNSTGGQACDLVSPIIGANGENFAAGADFEFCTSPPTDNVYRWPNPTGGKPTGTYANTDVVVESLGTAVSTKNSGSRVGPGPKLDWRTGSLFGEPVPFSVDALPVISMERLLNEPVLGRRRCRAQKDSR